MFGGEVVVWVTEAAVCCKTEAVVSHGSSTFERVVREAGAGAALVCDARVSAMAARCMKSTADVFLWVYTVHLMCQ